MGPQGPVCRAVLLQGKTRRFSSGSGRARDVRWTLYRWRIRAGVRQARIDGEITDRRVCAASDARRVRTSGVGGGWRRLLESATETPHLVRPQATVHAGFLDGVSRRPWPDYGQRSWSYDEILLERCENGRIGLTANPPQAVQTRRTGSIEDAPTWHMVHAVRRCPTGSLRVYGQDYGQRRIGPFFAPNLRDIAIRSGEARQIALNANEFVVLAAERPGRPI